MSTPSPPATRLHRHAQHTVVSDVIATAAASAQAVVSLSPSTKGPAPTRQTRTARIAAPPNRRAQVQMLRLMAMPPNSSLYSPTVARGPPGCWFIRSTGDFGQHGRQPARGLRPVRKSLSPGPGRRAEPLALPRVTKPPAQRLPESLRVAGRDQQAGPAAVGCVAEGLGYATDLSGDDRKPAGKRLG